MFLWFYNCLKSDLIHGEKSFFLGKGGIIILKSQTCRETCRNLRDRLTNGLTGRPVRDTDWLSDRPADWLTASQETSRISQGLTDWLTDWLADWLTKGQRKSCRQTERNEYCEHHPGGVNSRPGDTVGRWPGGGEIEEKRWGVKRTGCNTEGCWGGEMRCLNCWCKRGHTPFFFLSLAHVHTLTHTQRWQAVSTHGKSFRVQGFKWKRITAAGRIALLLSGSFSRSFSFQSWSSIFFRSLPSALLPPLQPPPPHFTLALFPQPPSALNFT